MGLAFISIQVMQNNMGVITKYHTKPNVPYSMVGRTAASGNKDIQHDGELHQSPCNTNSILAWLATHEYVTAGSCMLNKAT
jgi:hypothetical protein